MTAIPTHHFRAVLADPPWEFKTYSAKGLGKSPQGHYDCMPTPAIEALWADLDLSACVHRDCWLFLWGTWPMLPDAYRVMAAWGFKYAGGLPWVKVSAGGKPLQGTGHILRGVTEPLLIGKRGHPRVGKAQAGILWEAIEAGEAAMVAQRRRHSEKPDDVYQLVEGIARPPALELFARKHARNGWHAWGNQVGVLDTLSSGGAA